MIAQRIPRGVRRESQHRHPRDDRPLRLRPERGHHRRRLGLRGPDRISRRSSARGRARPEARLSGRPPAGFGVAVPDAAREHRLAGHARQARRDAVARERAARRRLGDGRRARAAARGARRGRALRRELLPLLGGGRPAGAAAPRGLGGALLPRGERRAPRVAVQRRHPGAAHQRDVAQPSPLLAEASQRRRVPGSRLSRPGRSTRCGLSCRRSPDAIREPERACASMRATRGA